MALAKTKELELENIIAHLNYFFWMAIITKNHKNDYEDWIIRDNEKQNFNMLSAIWDVNHHPESQTWLERWVMSESWSNMTTWARILSVFIWLSQSLLRWGSYSTNHWNKILQTYFQIVEEKMHMNHLKDHGSGTFSHLILVVLDHDQGSVDQQNGKVSVWSFLPHIYHPQWSCEGYVFTPVCQSFCSQGGLPQCTLGYHHPPGAYTPGPGTRWDQAPLQTRHPPRPGTPRTRTPCSGPGTPCLGPGTPPRTRHPRYQAHPPGPGTPPSRRLLLRTVRILLECILVCYILIKKNWQYKSQKWSFCHPLSYHLKEVEEEHGILTNNGRMFSRPHFHFQFKSVNIFTILTSKLKMCTYI